MLPSGCWKHLESTSPPGPSPSLPVTNTQDSPESTTSERGGQRRGPPPVPDSCQLGIDSRALRTQNRDYWASHPLAGSQRRRTTESSRGLCTGLHTAREDRTLHTRGTEEKRGSVGKGGPRPASQLKHRLDASRSGFRAPATRSLRSLPGGLCPASTHVNG